VVISRRLKRQFRYAVFLAGLVASALFALPGFAVAEDGDPPDHVVRAIRQGSEIEYLGEIGFGAAAELDKILAGNPQAKLLHLNSPGGDVAEAYRMVKVVEARGLTTTVDKLCVSACTLVFLAGQQRLISSSARMGFHRPLVPSMSDAEMAQFVQHDRDFMRERGVSQWFVDKTYATPNSDVWYPTTSELTSSKFITGVTDKYVIDVGKYSTVLVQESFVLQEFLNAVKQRSPSSYRVLHQLLLRDVTSGAAEGSSFDSKLSVYLFAFMAHAEDRAVLNVVAVVTRILGRLASGDPETCFAALRPSKTRSSAAILNAVGFDDVRTLNLAQMRAATNGALVYLATPTEQEVEAPFERAIASLREEYPDDVHAVLNPDSVDKATLCRAEAHFLVSLERLSREDAGEIARFMFASETRDIDLGAGPGASSAKFPSSPASQPRPYLLHPDK
jgi:hypothetical protein